VEAAKICKDLGTFYTVKAVSAGMWRLPSSNGNDIETKAERSFDLDFIFDIEAKRTCLFQNL
jgi:hypothetical protein